MSEGEDAAEDKAGNEAAEMGEDVGVRTEAEEDEEEEAGGDAAGDVTKGFAADAPEVNGMDGEHAEGAHHHAGGAEAGVGIGAEEIAGEVPGGSGEQGGQKGEAGAVSGHAEAENEQAEGDVAGEVREVVVEEDGGEKAPPLAGVNLDAVHDAAVEQAGGLVVHERMDHRDDDAEDD